MTPKLSVCIATLNRGAFIGATLDSIISQATDEVEIIIVDGASTDNTPEVVRSYQEKFPRLTYIRLPQKGGVDKDYDRTVEAAMGEYCWLMSDDDLLKPGAIAAVLAATQQRHDLIVVNAEVRGPDLIEVVEPSRLTHRTDRVYASTETDQLMVDTATYMTFIGCVVIRRAVWLAREREKYYGYEFIHIGVIYQKPLTGTSLVIAKPWIIIRHGNAQWTTRYFKIWMYNWPTLIWSFPDYADSIKRQVVPKEPWKSLKILTILKAKGSMSPKDYTTFLKDTLTPRWKNRLVKLIAYTPGCLINPPVIVYFKLRRSNQLYGIREFCDSPYYWKNCLRRVRRRS